MSTWVIDRSRRVIIEHIDGCADLSLRHLVAAQRCSAFHFAIVIVLRRQNGWKFVDSLAKVDCAKSSCLSRPRDQRIWIVQGVAQTRMWHDSWLGRDVGVQSCWLLLIVGVCNLVGALRWLEAMRFELNVIFVSLTANTAVRRCSGPLVTAESLELMLRLLETGRLSVFT